MRRETTAQLVTEVLILAIWRGGKVYRTRNEARADMFDYIERSTMPSAGTRPSAASVPLSSSGRWDWLNCASTEPAAGHDKLLSGLPSTREWGLKSPIRTAGGGPALDLVNRLQG